MKVSIVTPTYNSERFIRDSLESIKNQTHSNIEHVICDNMSSDKTKEICLDYNNLFIQQADSSMYEALNNGILKTTGEIVCFLNSDDLYFDNRTIERVVDRFSRDDSCQVVFGRCRRVDEDLKFLYSHKPKKDLTFDFAKKRIFVVSHPSVFIRKSVFERYGLYDLNLKFMADCEYWIRLLKENIKFNYIDKELAIFRIHDENLSLTNHATDEIRYVANKYGYTNSPAKARLYLLYDNKFNFNYIKFLTTKYISKLLK